MRTKRLAALASGLCVFCFSEAALAQPVRSDPAVLQQLFGEETLATNARQACAKARMLPPRDRFRHLLQWVVPDNSQPAIRLDGDFRSAHNASSKDQKTADAFDRLLPPDVIDCPAMLLVETAVESDQLNELRDFIQSLPHRQDGVHPQRLALQFLIETADRNAEAARRIFAEFAVASADVDRTDPSTGWAEFVVFYAGTRWSETRRMVGNYFYGSHNDPLESSDISSLDPLDLYVKALHGIFQHLELNAADQNDTLATATQTAWIPYSQTSASSIGRGVPLANWELADGKAFRITGHSTDYLAFASPLRGNFQVECDVHPGASRNIGLLVAGTWIEMTDQPSRALSGTTGTDPHIVQVAPPLSDFREVVRLRATVRDGRLTHFINGRPVFAKDLPPNHDPWVAIRIGSGCLGVVRDLRITGNPVVPVEIDLLTGNELAGWSAYDEQFRANWRMDRSAADVRELHSPRRRDLDGTFAENLLQYLRPMIEDGTIEYEFYYVDGESVVSPAIGRQAFLLSPEGVQIHEVTNGKYSRTELGPDNKTSASPAGEIARPLKLVDRSWNRMAVTLQGDHLELFLNDERIAPRQLKETDDRTFGLFHYLDRSDARVRNIIWRGNWTRPSFELQEQQLAHRAMHFLDESLPGLSQSFDYDFSNNKDLYGTFAIVAGDEAHFEQRPEGVHVTRPFSKGYHNSTLSPKVQLKGDFDITARFEQFSPEIIDGASGGVFLQVAVENPTWDQVRVHRRFERHKSRDRAVMKCMAIQQRGSKPIFSGFEMVMEESTWGTLRLARRGEMVYLLYAQEDSPNFRLLGECKSTADDIHEVHLGVQSQHDSVVKVLWKQLTIRAEAIETPAALVERLNVQREQLAKQFRFDFDVDEFPATAFRAVGSVASADKATRMTSTAGDGYFGSKVMTQFRVVGDFDAEFGIRDFSCAPPDSGQNSAVYLQVEVPNAQQTQANIIFETDSQGRFSAYIQLRDIDELGKEIFRKVYTERFTADEFMKLEKLRVARQGTRIAFLYRMRGTDRDVAIIELEFSNLRIPLNSIRLMLHSGSNEEVSSLRLKHFEIHADDLEPTPGEAP